MKSGSQIGPSWHFLFANCARLLVASGALICVAHMFGPLCGQGFSPCGSNICAPTGASVGIGTTTPFFPFQVIGNDAFTASNSSGIFIFPLQGSANGSVNVIDSTYVAGGAVLPLVFQVGNSETMRIAVGGNVGIGTTSPVHPLQVVGTIGATEVIVSSTGADYVFEQDYRLQPLSEVAGYIKQNHHLPEIPSATEAKEKGVSVGEMQSKLLAKIEELTLHMIQADERNNRLEQQNRELWDEIREVKRRI
jgi:hypothetical protein